jgi:hypothetical protein
VRREPLGRLGPVHRHGGGHRRRSERVDRTLSLVYAADLAFRLRWEIRPVLEAGGVVIAAPYIDTAAAFGAICGLDEEWLRRLMRFAPAAGYRGLVDERKIDRPWKRRTDRGYAEYGALLLEAAAPKARLEAGPAPHDDDARSGARPQGLPPHQQGYWRAREGAYWQPEGRVAPVCVATSQRT